MSVNITDFDKSTSLNILNNLFDNSITIQNIQQTTSSKIDYTATLIDNRTCKLNNCLFKFLNVDVTGIETEINITNHYTDIINYIKANEQPVQLIYICLVTNKTILYMFNLLNDVVVNNNQCIVDLTKPIFSTKLINRPFNYSPLFDS